MVIKKIIGYVLAVALFTTWWTALCQKYGWKEVVFAHLAAIATLGMVCLIVWLLTDEKW